MSDVETTTTAEPTTGAPEATTTATPPPAEPPKPAAKKDAASDLDRWRAKLDRQAEANKRKLDEIHESRRQLEEERKAHVEKLTKAEQLEQKLARLKEGDPEAFKEVAGDDFFDKLTRSQLDPEATRQQAEIRKALEQRDSEIAALKKEMADWKRQQEDQQRQAEMQRQGEVFLATARARDTDELSIYDDGELFALANHFGSQLARDLGRDPTMAEVIDAIVEHEARPRFERLQKRGYTKAAAPPAAKKPAPPTEPSTVTAADATAPTGEAPRTPRSAREKREALRREMESKLRDLSSKTSAA